MGGPGRRQPHDPSARLLAAPSMGEGTWWANGRPGRRSQGAIPLDGHPRVGDPGWANGDQLLGLSRWARDSTPGDRFLVDDSGRPATLSLFPMRAIRLGGAAPVKSTLGDSGVRARGDGTWLLFACDRVDRCCFCPRDRPTLVQRRCPA